MANHCFRCGGVITSKHGKKFCSIRCAALNANAFAAAATRVDHRKTCLECQREFNATNNRAKFCSHSCSAKCSNRKLYPLRKRPCSRCPESTRGVAGGKKIYKRTACTWQCKRQRRIQEWLDGAVDFSTTHGISQIVRDYLLEKAGFQCEACGYSKARRDGKSILQVHHRDGNWRNCRPENLNILCPNCHALTENYGARNVGNGRKWKAAYRYNGSVEKPAGVV